MIMMFLCSFPLDGKDAACDAGAVPILSQLLTEQSTLVKASAAGALMAYVFEFVLQKGNHHLI